MKKLHLRVLPIIMISFLFFSCKKEQSLSPNEDAAKRQQAGIDFLNNGGQIDLGDDDGDSPSVDQFMMASVDGSVKSYNSFFYMENGSSLSISGSDNSNATAISFTLLNIPNAGDTIDLGDQLEGSGTYVPGVAMAYTSVDGELIVDSSTTAFMKGRFYFNAKNTAGSDTIKITSGSFKLAK